jgi:hypothetical protein
VVELLPSISRLGSISSTRGQKEVRTSGN